MTAESRASSSSDVESVPGTEILDDQDGGAQAHNAISGTVSAVLEATPSNHTIPDEAYDRFPKGKKLTIVLFLAYCSFLAPISSTTTLSAVPEIASDLDTNGDIINLSNGLYLLFMGLSPMFCGPLSEFYGRRVVSIIAGGLFTLCSLATALCPELISFFVFRILTAIAGTAFILVGTSVVSDIYRPVERGTAASWILTGQLIGPAIGPFVGGVIVTYRSWRVIFWLQTALSGVAWLATFFVLPETIHHRKADDLAGYSGSAKLKYLWSAVNPGRILALWIYPNILLVSLASSALLWNMYGLLAPIRYVLNPRYNLTTPLEGGLFYLAPGVGYLVGTLFGGRFADYIVKRYMKKRGRRVPEDRLISSLPFMALVAACILVYGWTVEKNVGGIPVTVICMFLQGVAQLCCFPALNTYCLDVMPGRSAEAISANYSIRYLFGFIATSIVLPAIKAMGVGWFSTLTVFLLLLSEVGLVCTVLYGEKMRNYVDQKKKARRMRHS